MDYKKDIIELYNLGYSKNYIVKKIHKLINKNYYKNFFINGVYDKKLYKNIETSRYLVEKTILDYVQYNNHL